MLEKILGKFGKKKPPVRKVLVVEDDALLAKVLSLSLLKENFKVSIVDNGLNVIDGVDKFSPDIILLDLIIPGIDGFEVLKQLKAGAKTKDIPVIVLSNLSDEGDIKSTKALGADEYFIKSNTEVTKIVNFVKQKLDVA